MSATLHVFESRARTYRHVWRASVFSTFLSPTLYLLAMGLGLGSLVDRGDAGASMPGGSYLAFLAPGLLVATAMQIGAGDSSWPVMAGMKWQKTYHAALATPVGTADLVRGHVLWVAVRLVMAALAFVVVMAAFGAAELVQGLAATPAAILTGLAFATPVMAYAATLEQDTGLGAMFRFGIVPMFLFSGTFFPITQLPGWLQPVAYVTPLWHGVELARGAALGLTTSAPWWVHAGYLAIVVAVGLRLAERQFRRRLVR